MNLRNILLAAALLLAAAAPALAGPSTRAYSNLDEAAAEATKLAKLVSGGCPDAGEARGKRTLAIVPLLNQLLARLPGALEPAGGPPGRGHSLQHHMML